MFTLPSNSYLQEFLYSCSSKDSCPEQYSPLPSYNQSKSTLKRTSTFIVLLRKLVNSSNFVNIYNIAQNPCPILQNPPLICSQNFLENPSDFQSLNLLQETFLRELCIKLLPILFICNTTDLLSTTSSASLIMPTNFI